MEDFNFIQKYVNIKEWTVEDAKQYATDLAKADLLYHIDDDANDINWGGVRRISHGILGDLNTISQNIKDDVRVAFFDKALQLIEE